MVSPRHFVARFERVLVLACVFTLAGSSAAQPTDTVALDLMPVPASVRRLEGSFALGDTLSVAVVGPHNERIERALERFVARLAIRTDKAHRLDRVDEARRATLVIDCPQPLVGLLPSLEDDESYRLSVTSQQIALGSAGPLGVLRGLATLAQLPTRDGDAWILPAVEIADAPRFPWRGLMIDVVRHWQPMEVIERNLDAMEAVKLNVLHLHLSDDQAFRVESRTHPRLHEIASGGDYYTHDEIRGLVEYAADRGVRVVPEFDVPGHVTSWFVAYPELGSDPAEPPELPRPGGGLFHNALDPTREETYAFLDGLFGEMADLFPDSYIHVGGDEVSGESWRADERIGEFMEENGLEGTKGLQGHFTSRILAIVNDHGKIGVGWDGILGAELPAGTVVQLWLPGADPGQARSLVSGGFYLDHMLRAAKHYTNEPWDHLPTEASRQELLGGEACIWGEAIDSDTIDSRIWPRAAAIAERFWSQRGVRDVEDMYRRLAIVRADLTRLGLRHDTYYEPALARLTGDELRQPLKTLADLCEPPSLLGRLLSIQAMGSMLAPSLPKWLIGRPEVGTRFEDVLQPESRIGAAFGVAVADSLDSPDSESKRRAVEEQLGRWQSNHDEILKLLDKYPNIEEIEPVSAGLARLADVGLRALEVLEGKGLFSEREKRLHLELLALHEPVQMDLSEIELPEDEDLADVVPGIIIGRAVAKLKTLEPLIKFRVSIASQPGIEALVLAAHEKGTRDVGPLMAFVWSVYDRRAMMVSVVAALALVWLFMRRRRMRRAA